MKKLKQLCAATTLLFVLSLSALAGTIQGFLRPTKFLADRAALNIQSAEPKLLPSKYWVPANNVIQFV